MKRLLSSLIAAAVVAVLAASSGVASSTTVPARQFASNAGAQSVSANWSGYALQDANAAGLQFTSVTGTWTVPVTTCSAGSTSSAAFWVGLGGSSDAATGLEQTGTGADCTNGTVRYYAWYEILPAASVEVPLKVKPGDQITTSVNVKGTTVLVQIKNRTRKTSFTKALQVAAPDLSSAEWIAEAPSACNTTGRCTVLPLANFGAVAFTRAAAIASSHPGTITDPTWANDPISLVPQSSRFFAGQSSSSAAGATPGALSADGRSFGVTWVANATP
ncbi:MAG: G1 family glutamic endopeptidase [Gaiellaceae bacterium]